MSPNQEPKGVRHKKASLPQTDVPSYPLMEALRVPRALAAELGKQPATPLQVAKALGVAPTTGAFRTVTASSVAYGLTDGAAFAEKISLTDLGRRIVAPTADGDEAAGMLQAVMLPRVTRAFLQRYNGSRWPREDIGRNVLEDELDVHRDQSARALQLIHIDADSLGLLVRINDEEYVRSTLCGQLRSPQPSWGRLSLTTDRSNQRTPQQRNMVRVDRWMLLLRDSRRTGEYSSRTGKIRRSLRK